MERAIGQYLGELLLLHINFFKRRTYILQRFLDFTKLQVALLFRSSYTSQVQPYEYWRYQYEYLDDLQYYIYHKAS